MTNPILAEAFWGKVEVGAPDECWLWLGSKDRNGYGTLSVAGRRYRATRLAWSFHYRKPWPEDLYGLHRCDNPPCVNPAHIFPGTLKDNAHDQWAKGRQSGTGAKNASKTHCQHGHPLAGDNLHIYTHAGRGRPVRICRICARNKAYRNSLKYRVPDTGRGGVKLSPPQVAEIAASTERPVALAQRHGVHPSTIRRIQKGELWKSLLALNDGSKA